MALIRSIGNLNEIDRILNRDFTCSLRPSYVEVGEDNMCLPVYYKDFAEKINKFTVREDDVFLCGHPKTGTTWTQEMVWLIMNNLDFDTALKTPLTLRSAILEFATLWDIKEMLKNVYDVTANGVWESLVNQPSPRVIKSHLHWSLLPEEIRNGTKTPKIIVTLRNPEDVCVSLYYHSQTTDSYKGTFEDFCKLFLAGRVLYGPFWKQVLSFWNERHRSNIFFLYYKDMVEDLQGTIKKVVNFLGKSFTDEEIVLLSKHLSFDSMKNNPAVNLKDSRQLLKNLGLCVVETDFIRSGKVGENKLKMSPEQLEAFKNWKKANTEETILSNEL